jgi:alpha-D-ribose 1-methylphosphonate 5-triphosphate synthase subunit PhnH
MLVVAEAAVLTEAQTVQAAQAVAEPGLFITVQTELREPQTLVVAEAAAVMLELTEELVAMVAPVSSSLATLVVSAALAAR